MNMKKMLSGLVAMTMLSGCFTMFAKTGNGDAPYYATVPADIVTFPLQVGLYIVFLPMISDFAKIK